MLALLPMLVAQAGSRGGDGGQASTAVAGFVDRVVAWTTMAFELLGVTVIVVGTIWAFGKLSARSLAQGANENRYDTLRAELGRAILLGLELLVAADIISTVAVRPTIDSVLALGLIVLIRTFLSFSLEVEINGRWPWQAKEQQ